MFNNAAKDEEVKIRCPDCHGKAIRSDYLLDIDMDKGTHWDIFCCVSCNSVFKVQYKAIRIEK